MTIESNTIFINGEPLNYIHSMSLHDLIEYLDFNVDTVIIECNQQIIPRNKLNTVLCKHQDRLEIITIVGGG
uniref:Thiamin biosynthesis protein S n=1 Tax=Dicranema revolutum TaxID=239144 RepID=A0A4D6WUR0_9FLOR|nr:Thiamin biosynthesis protein S [Dicranema revolutum]